MKYKKLTQKDYKTTNWSGGTTTEICIYPDQSCYAERDFLWRISSATIDSPISQFTALPQYYRFLSTLDNSIVLSHNETDNFILEPLSVYSFDGGLTTQSQGKCRDFNLMLYKNRCEGELVSLQLSPHEQQNISLPLPHSPYPIQCLIYCTSGTVSLSFAQESLTISSGEGVFLEDTVPISLTLQTHGQEGTKLMMATMTQTQPHSTLE